MAVQPKPESHAPDPLTGLPTRAAFEDALPERLRAAKRDAAPVVLAVIDIDRCGRINDAHGRDAGDAVIQRTADALDAEFDGVGQIYRYGGDALAIVSEGIERESVFLRLEDVRRAFAERETPMDGEAPAFSAGLAAYPEDGVKANAIVQKANEALYRAKVSGRNKICLAREEKMVTKTSHYAQGQLMGLRRLAEREGIGEAELLREALNDLLRKHNA